MRDPVYNSIIRDYLKEGFIGQHPIFKNLLQNLIKIAAKDVTVLIIGETGSGKGCCAEFIHQFSDRNSQPFIPYNCGLGPDSLFESQLFGHVKGAFTGALASRIGLVEDAKNGVLFLDEINSLSLDSQIKLNYFLETGRFRHVGDNRLLCSNVRVISASNIDLRLAMKERQFREDLYYRLAEYELFVPPLRSRKEDIPLLVDYYLKKFADLNQSECIKILPKALQDLQDYDWPGNIRELENVLKRLIIDANSSTIESVTISLDKKSSFQSPDLHFSNFSFKEAKKRFLDDFIKSYLQNVLKKYHGIVAKCARHAGMHPSDFWKLMHKYKLKVKDFRDSD